MSKADQIFKQMCRDILDHGYSSEGERFGRIGRMARRRIPSSALPWSIAMI